MPIRNGWPVGTPAMNPDAGTAVLLFAKAPEPGCAKTRLEPALGSGGAAVLAARLLQRALGTACEAAIGPVTLCCAPDAGHPAFTELARQSGATLADQGEGDLGERMHRALAGALVTHDTAVLVGADIPHMATADLVVAAERLRNGADLVLGPAVDGGYWLIGARRVDARLFEGIAWSTSRVLDLTRERASSLGWSLQLVTRHRDVDRPGDLDWLAADPACAPLVADLLAATEVRRPPT